VVAAGLVFGVIEFINNIAQPPLFFFRAEIKSVYAVGERAEICTRAVFERDVMVKRKQIIVSFVIDPQVFPSQVIS